MPAWRDDFLPRLEEAVGVAQEAVALPLPEQILVQILAVLYAMAAVPGGQDVVQAAALPVVVIPRYPEVVHERALP